VHKFLTRILKIKTTTLINKFYPANTNPKEEGIINTYTGSNNANELDGSSGGNSSSNRVDYAGCSHLDHRMCWTICIAWPDCKAYRFYSPGICGLFGS
jgi:hypothetical protein